ncbi:MAG: hypothetical protein KAI81_09125, partial [Candidatus Marinimicrobia bacterium]|nr:hypothetical protein [Candidatus Neomarinimicrobiota bacterium]
GDFWINGGDTIAVQDTMELGLDTTVSIQIVHWWGEDPDGEVKGFYYQWSYMDTAVYIEAESDTFYLPLRSQFDIYTFKVQAVDDKGSLDPSPAQASIPVRNTVPEIEWKLNTLPPVQSSADVTHKSFTHHSFFWDAEDLDGLETITQILWALDDTSNWQVLEGDIRSLFVGPDLLNEGEHRIFFRAKDIAGSYSNIISFPDPEDEDHPNTWEVIRPKGDFLIVNDYFSDQLNYTHQNFYTSIVEELTGSDGYSIWEIGGGATNVQNSIPYATEDIEKNLGYFSKVFWFTYRGGNSISQSALALTRFVSDGGTLLMNNAMKYTDQASPDTSWTFTNIDTVYSLSPNGLLMKGSVINASWEDSILDSSLTLSLSIGIYDRLWGIEPGGSSKIRYRFEVDSLNLSDYSGTPGLMIETPINKGKTYYFSIPLTYCNGNDNISDLFKHIFGI